LLKLSFVLYKSSHDTRTPANAGYMQKPLISTNKESDLVYADANFDPRYHTAAKPDITVIPAAL